MGAGVPSTGLPSTSQLPFKSFDDLVNDLTARWGGATGTTPNLTSGSIALALFQTLATQFVFFEFLLQAVIAMARLSTSSGSDVDSFIADFGMTPRLPATFPTGPVTLSLLTARTTDTPIPIGSLIQSPGGAFQYELIADTTQPAYNPTLQAYVLPAGQTSITATAQSLSAGSNQNVLANTLTQLAAAGTGVDTVTNPAPIQNGLDQETDAQVKARFILFIAALSKATKAAILYAIASTQQGLDVNLLENTAINGTLEYGFFTVVVEDGSGTLPAALQNALSVAINAIRAFTIQFAVIGPTLVNPTIALAIRILSGANFSAVSTNVKNAILAYVNSLPIGAPLYLNRIVEVAIDADPNVVSVQPGSTLINDEPEDLTITGVQLVRSTGVISISSY